MRPYISKTCEVEADGSVVIVGHWEGLALLLLPAAAAARLLMGEPVLVMVVFAAVVVGFLTRPRRRIRFDAARREIVVRDTGWFARSPPALPFDDVASIEFDTRETHGGHDKCAVIAHARKDIPIPLVNLWDDITIRSARSAIERLIPPPPTADAEEKPGKRRRR